MKEARVPSRSLVVLLAILVAGCEPAGETETPVAPVLESPSNIESYITGAATRAVGADGLFHFNGPRRTGRPTLSRDEAVAVALAFIREFGPYSRHMLEHQHGAPIDFSALSASERVYVAESPYESVPDDAPVPVRKVLGPYYMVTLTQNGVPAVSLAVSAYATDLKLVDGLVVPPTVYGNEFRMVGVPADGKYGSPIPPEAAVEIVSRKTGALVRDQPVFVTRGVQWFPHFGHWRVELDRSIAVSPQDGGPAIHTNVAYVARDGSLGIASTKNNGPEEIHYRRGGKMTSIRAFPRGGFARNIVQVNVLNAGGAQ